jgi:hypothetical protein
MVFDNLGKKGQLSIELLLIISVVLLLLQLIIFPMRDSTESAIGSMSQAYYADKAFSELQNNYLDLKDFTEARKQIKVYVPGDTNFYFASSEIKFETYFDFNVDDSQALNYCNENMCSKFFSHDLTLTPITINGPKHLLVTFNKTNEFNLNIEAID